MNQTLYDRTENHLTVWDYAAVAVFLAVSAFFGVFYGFIRHQHTSSHEAYFLGHRELQVIPVAVSLMASFFSAIAMVS